jgi:hypothetical protein
MTALQAARERLEEYVRVCYLRQDRLDTVKLRRMEDDLIQAVRAFQDQEPF